MKTYIKEDILKIYEESGKIIYQATLDGNYKLNNKEGKKLIKYFKYFETNRPFALSCISDMLSSENVVVRTKAAAYLLALNEDIDVAKSILSEISDNNEYVYLVLMQK